MAQIISIHSFRGGTGKSNTTASLAVLLAAKGKRVGVIDTDIQSPGIHILFGLEESQMQYALNDYLWGKCAVEEAVYDVTPVQKSTNRGKLFLIPSSLKPGEIARILREGYDISQLSDGFLELIESKQLDVLLVDTHPGLNEETLLSIALSDVLVIVLRPDQQDYQGTDVTVTVARRLQVPKMTLIVNKVPSAFDLEEIKVLVERTYACEVTAVLPHADEMMILGGNGIFATHYPDHPITQTLAELAASL